MHAIIARFGSFTAIAALAAGCLGSPAPAPEPQPGVDCCSPGTQSSGPVFGGHLGTCDDKLPVCAVPKSTEIGGLKIEEDPSAQSVYTEVAQEGPDEEPVLVRKEVIQQ